MKSGTYCTLQGMWSASCMNSQSCENLQHSIHEYRSCHCSKFFTTIDISQMSFLVYDSLNRKNVVDTSANSVNTVMALEANGNHVHDYSFQVVQHLFVHYEVLFFKYFLDSELRANPYFWTRQSFIITYRCIQVLRVQFPTLGFPSRFFKQ